jgi:hypothetical protein
MSNEEKKVFFRSKKSEKKIMIQELKPIIAKKRA